MTTARFIEAVLECDEKPAVDRNQVGTEDLPPRFGPNHLRCAEGIECLIFVDNAVTVVVDPIADFLGGHAGGPTHVRSRVRGVRARVPGN
jgi:hypothetical protein